MTTTPHTSHAPTTPSEMLRSAVESAGFTIDGLPDDLTEEQVGGLAQALLHETTRFHRPDIAALLDAGDVKGAARALVEGVSA